jgi:peptidoglycan hydrolase CwlO-like protein
LSKQDAVVDNSKGFRDLDEFAQNAATLKLGDVESAKSQVKHRRHLLRTQEKKYEKVVGDLASKEQELDNEKASLQRIKEGTS